MRFSLSWLHAHLASDASADALAHAMTSIGLEVEALDNPSAALDTIKVVEVLNVLPHPNADRLQLAEINDGKETMRLVCGAPNLRKGMKTPWAQPGSSLPSGMKITARKVRGEHSTGMLCSAKELGLGEDASGILALPDDTKRGLPLSALPDVADPIFTLSITPNRSDCFAVRGIARDLAAAGYGKLKALPIKKVKPSFAGGVKVLCEDKQFCPHFAARLIRGAKNRPSPDWLKRKLEQAGLRPLHAFADITNFIALDLARPLHAYDAAKIKGTLRARAAQKEESLLALDHKTYQPAKAGAGVIADDEKVLGLGGIIGGEKSSCSLETRDVILESAWFDPIQIGRAGRALNIDTEARRRFERGVDPDFLVAGLELASNLLLELCGGEAGDIVADGAPVPAPKAIGFSLGSVKKLIGLEVKPARAKKLLEGLGCQWQQGDNKKSISAKVRPPSFRPDLKIEEDLVEEIMRLEGCDALKPLPLPPRTSPRRPLPPAEQQLRVARRFLASLGFVEAIRWSLIAHDKAKAFGGGEVQVSSPLAEHMVSLRPSLVPGLLDSVQYNLAHGEKDFSLFEAGHVFPRNLAPNGEATALAGVMVGHSPRHWRSAPRRQDVFDLKQNLFALLHHCQFAPEKLPIDDDVPDWLHPQKSGRLALPQGGDIVFGAIHPDMADLFECGEAFVFEWLWQAQAGAWVSVAKETQAQADLHPVRRDLAFIAPLDCPAQNLVRAIYAAGGEEITALSLFDLFQSEERLGKDKKSLAFELVLRPAQRSDAETEALMQRIAKQVKKRTGAFLRDQ